MLASITQEKEIRLLVLEPGAPGDELKCSLVNSQLSWRTKYEALSYTWGDATVTRPLSCSGHTINVTTSLHDALTDLRYQHRPRVLWVDAVCINQADNSEKAKQVILIGEIYSQAWQVLIYLGKMDASVSGAMKQIRWLDWKFTPLYIRRYFLRSAAFGPLGDAFIDSLPTMKPIPREKFDWNPIVNLLQRLWFQRTWIIHEATLAKRAQVICGDQSVPWATFESVVVCLNAYKAFVDSIPRYHLIDAAVRGVHVVRAVRRDRYQHIRTPNMMLLDYVLERSPAVLREYTKLLDLILDRRTFACTNPSDKIFGMLGITGEDTHSEYVTPNYNTTPGNVFRNFVLWEILYNKSLCVLDCSSDKTGSDWLNSPSWVPDFTRLDFCHSLTCGEKRVSFHASGETSIQARVSKDGTVLHLRGRVIDRLHSVGRNSLPDSPTISIDHGRSNLLKQGKITLEDGFQDHRVMIQDAVDIWQAARRRQHANGSASPSSPTASLFDHKTKESGSLVSTATNQLPPNWEPFLRTLVYDRTFDSKSATAFFLPSVAAYVRLVLGGLKADPGLTSDWVPQVLNAVEPVFKAQ